MMKPATRRHMNKKTGSHALPVAMLCIAAICVVLIVATLALQGPGNTGPAAHQTQAAASAAASEGRDSSKVSAGSDTGSSQALSHDEQGEAAAKRVSAAIQADTKASGGTVAVWYQRLDNPSSTVSINADERMRSASMIKLLILAELLQQSNDGKINLEDIHILTASERVGGTGPLQGRAAGTPVKIRDLARLMISESDNTATNILIDLLGVDKINARAIALGLRATSLNRKMMDEAAVAAGRDNYTSAADMGRILALIAKDDLVSADASRLALEFLLAQTDGVGIAQGLPQGTAFAHKTGTLAGARHDGGIVEADKPYVLVVMTENLDEGAANALMAKISSDVWDVSAL